MWLDENPEWRYTLIVVAICIVINSTLPIWLRLARLRDDREYAIAAARSLDDSDREGSDGKEINDAPHATSDAAPSMIESQFSTMLEARPRKKGRVVNHNQRRKRERDIRFAVGMQNFKVEVSTNDELEIVPSNDSVDFARSAMSRLSGDDVNDGVDEIVGARKKLQKSPYEKRGWSQVIFDITQWDSSLTSLAGFYMIQGLVESINGIVHVAIVGHAIGIQEANAFIMVQFLFEITGVLVSGFQEAIGVLVPQADGCGNDLLVGRYLQIGVIFSILFQIPGLLLWSFYTYDTIIWFGFDEATAAIAQDYTYSVLLLAVIEDVDECLTGFLDVIGREKYVTVYCVISEFVSTGLLVAVAYSNVASMVAVGLAETVVALTAMFLNIIYIVNKGWLDDYIEGLVRTFGLKDWRAMRTAFVTAAPLSLAWFLTMGEWQVMLIFAQYIGPDEVAVWNLLGYVWEFFEVLTDAISEAAEVRVGFRMGAGKPQEARKMSERTIYIGTHLATITTGVLFATAGIILPLITPNPVYQKLLFDQIPLIGFSGILMVPGLIIEGILCAQGRVRLMTIIEIVVSWFVVVPLAALLVYYFDFGIDGIIAGLVIGYSIGVNILLFYFLRSNWEQFSDRVIKQNAANGAQQLDTDWDELPEKVQKAASTLGYTKIMWESNMEPSSTEKSWDYLTQAERTAAGVFGYNKKKWNGESDNNNDSDCYDDYDFDELPKEVKAAAKFLGITRKIWDNDGTAPIEEYDWEELTEKQQNAARLLGYTQEKWDEDSDAESDSSSSESENITIPTMLEINYDDYDFKELPPDVMEAAKSLGYTKKIWDRGGKAPIEEYDWDELTAEQQSAARALGYTKQKWDEDSDSGSSSSEELEARKVPEAAPKKPRRRIPEMAPTRMSLDVSDFSATSDTAGVTILESEASSDTIGDSLITESEISVLRRRQQKAGVTRRKPGEHFGCSLTNFSECRFDDLPFDVQRAAMIVGFTRSTWDRNLFIPRKTQTWDRLTPAEMDAALMLGCTEVNWDKLLDSW